MSSFSQDAYPMGGGLNARPLSLRYTGAPNYGYSTFAPTPLGQGLGGSGGGGANNGPGLTSGAASSTTAAFHAPDKFSNFPHTITERGQRHQALLQRRQYHQFRKLQRKSGQAHQDHPRGERPELYQQNPHNVETKMELPSDIAEQQAAALNYEPELEGPKVGEKRSSNEIADAFIGDETHPVFVAKSRALPRKYSHWRKVQGDGNCGWRAIGFAYFETLVQRGDVDILSGELARVSSLDSYLMNVGGFDTMLFEDMTSVTLDLFQELIAAFEEGQDTGADATEHAMSILFDKWNDPDASNSMIYHLRLLAASYLKGNVAQYRDFIAVAGGADQSVDLYCDSWILPVAKEIDHVAIDLLFHVLIAGADIVLEIAYLDTNEGAEVKQGRWPPEANDMKPEELGPTINLLFRPGHYDLLYRRENQPPPPPPPSAPAVVQVNRVSSLSHQHQPQSNFSSLGNFSSIDMGIMSMIPGSSLGGPPSAFQPSVFGTPSPMSPMESAYSPPAQTTWIPQQSTDGPVAAPSPLSSSHSGPSQPSPQPQMPNPTRFSKYCFTVAAEPPAPPLPDSSHQALQTPTFKQSYYNPAHYANPGFTPEQWKPDQDDHVPRGRAGGRNKSS